MDRVRTTKGIVGYILDAYNPKDWGDSPTEKDFDEWLNMLTKFTKTDFEKYGMSVKHDKDGAAYLETPYGKTYLKDMPGYKEEQWQV